MNRTGETEAFCGQVRVNPIIPTLRTLLSPNFLFNAGFTPKRKLGIRPPSQEPERQHPPIPVEVNGFHAAGGTAAEVPAAASGCAQGAMGQGGRPWQLASPQAPGRGGAWAKRVRLAPPGAKAWESHASGAPAWHPQAPAPQAGGLPLPGAVRTGPQE